MLTIYRRHRNSCKQRHDGRSLADASAPFGWTGCSMEPKYESRLRLATGRQHTRLCVSGKQRAEGKSGPNRLW
jgi:hypothetical protein